MYCYVVHIVTCSCYWTFAPPTWYCCGCCCYFVVLTILHHTHCYASHHHTYVCVCYDLPSIVVVVGCGCYAIVLLISPVAIVPSNLLLHFLHVTTLYTAPSRCYVYCSLLYDTGLRGLTVCCCGAFNVPTIQTGRQRTTVSTYPPLIDTLFGVRWTPYIAYATFVGAVYTLRVELHVTISYAEHCGCPYPVHKTLLLFVVLWLFTAALHGPLPHSPVPLPHPQHSPPPPPCISTFYNHLVAIDARALRRTR